jgi:hypothetical protein
LSVLIIIGVLLLAACGPATIPTTPPKTPSGEVFMIALPRITVDYDSQGNPTSVLGLDLSKLGVQPQALKLPAQTTQLLTNGGVQHIELAFVGHGVVVYVDGKPLPYINWDDATLERAIGLAGAFGLQNADLYQQIVPMITRLGLDLVLRFPIAQGVAAIPMTQSGEAAKLTLTPTTEPASVVIAFEIKYDENGVPGILGVTASDLAVLGIPMPVGLAPATLQSLQAANIQSIELRSKPEGIFIYANNELLPNLAWDTATLTNLANLIAQLAPEAIGELVKALVPGLDRFDLDILIHFPVASGAEPIDVQMHP